MKCKHENQSEKHGETTCDWLGNIIYETQYRECLDCGAWLSLGEANDDDPNVAIEIRAATLADVMEREKLPSYFLQGNEYDGWSAHRHNTDFYRGEPIQNRRHWDAGYLTRAIATHEEQP